MYAKDVDDALDLLEKLLHPESVKRITPREALYHPFLVERGERERVRLFGGSSSSRRGKDKGEGDRREKGKGEEMDGEEVSKAKEAAQQEDDAVMDTDTVASSTKDKGKGKAREKLQPQGDDAFVPHVFGEGVCGEYHFIDEVTGQPGVFVRQRKCLCIPSSLPSPSDRLSEDPRSNGREGEGQEENGEREGKEGNRCEGAKCVVGEGEDGWEHVRRLVEAGEGIAIGERACEFHKGYKEGW
ncbi:hypothetical protein NMY22_g20215 [Coprinellus aureogranulatus]|nr:hypothetical protein NMY22_g20215 [Coprinellus aureogranulatus]